jgi:hypothetical protein
MNSVVMRGSFLTEQALTELTAAGSPACEREQIGGAEKSEILERSGTIDGNFHPRDSPLGNVSRIFDLTSKNVLLSDFHHF